eukprot:4254020-Pyramimonas_sp.AAC.1
MAGPGRHRTPSMAARFWPSAHRTSSMRRPPPKDSASDRLRPRARFGAVQVRRALDQAAPQHRISSMRPPLAAQFTPPFGASCGGPARPRHRRSSMVRPPRGSIEGVRWCPHCGGNLRTTSTAAWPPSN